MTQPTGRVLVALHEARDRLNASIAALESAEEVVVPEIATCSVCLRSLDRCGEKLCPGNFPRRQAANPAPVGADVLPLGKLIASWRREADECGQSNPPYALALAWCAKELERALLTPSPPAESGWRWVPVEPTPHMIEMGTHWLERSLTGIDAHEAESVENIWEAMLAAMLSAAPAREGDV